MTTREVVAADEVSSAVDLLAHELAVAMRGRDRWALVAIREGGVPLADRLADAISALGEPRPLRGNVDITLYRDDLYSGLEKPILGDTELEFEITGCGIVLVDDVLFTGRTVRAAMGEVWDYGRPAFIRLLVLVDRGHRELPISADYVGFTIETEKRDKVIVEWQPARVSVSR